jgi:hypothetical protein
MEGKRPGFTSIQEVRATFYPRMTRLVKLDPRELIGWPWRLPDEVEKAVREQMEAGDAG